MGKCGKSDFTAETPRAQRYLFLGSVGPTVGAPRKSRRAGGCPQARVTGARLPLYQRELLLDVDFEELGVDAAGGALSGDGDGGGTLRQEQEVLEAAIFED